MPKLTSRGSVIKETMMTTHTVIDLSGKRITYTEYTVKAGETTLHQIARDHLYDEKRFKEIKEWVKKTETSQEVTKALTPGQVLLIPPISEDIATFKLIALGGSNVRRAHIVNATSLIYTAPIDTPFHYSKKSLTKDSNGLLWVEVRTFKDNKNVLHSVGWICVKEGNAHYTAPPIDMAKATG
jgi:hypothetical protein